MDRRDWKLKAYDRHIAAMRRGHHRYPLVGTLPGIVLDGWKDLRREHQVEIFERLRAVARCKGWLPVK